MSAAITAACLKGASSIYFIYGCVGAFLFIPSWLNMDPRLHRWLEQQALSDVEVMLYWGAFALGLGIACWTCALPFTLHASSNEDGRALALPEGMGVVSSGQYPESVSPRPLSRGDSEPGCESIPKGSSDAPTQDTGTFEESPIIGCEHPWG